ncbi:MAG: hypothetical protein HKN33_02435 [Pyrinomonadaceae bacterium]|nr:hypothetical protein [Pyrinomonadaceae bacterium]
MQIFRDTGEELERRWRKAGYDEKVFPSIAADVLGSADIPSKVNAWELVEWILGQTELPVQQDLYGKFGDPPITLFNGPRFQFDVYFWLEGTTAVHQHSFCGAFQVFHGSSLHSQYKFETDRDLNYFARVGQTVLESCNILNVGDVQEIQPGEQYIHALFHLDQPSATVIARTTLSALNMPQYSYFKPGFAADPFFEAPITVKKIQFLSAAIRSDYEHADRLIEEFVRSNDFHTSFQMLQGLRPLLRQATFKEVFGIDAAGDRFDRIVSVVEEVHPDLGDLPRKLFTETLRLENIIALRNIVSDPEHRFFLALLLNVDHLEMVLSLIKERFPDTDPKERLLDWVSDLGNTRVIGDQYPNALGIADFDDFDTAVLEELIGGSSVEKIISSLLGDAAGEAESQRVASSIEKLKNSSVFGRLLEK